MRPMKNRTDACMVAFFKEIYEYLKEQKSKPKLHIMDTKWSKAVHTFIKEQEVPIQLVEPGNHDVNEAEMGVKTGNYQLISSLGTLAKSRLLQLWCQYIPQIEMVYASSRQFWYQVSWWRKRQAFIRSPQRILRNGRGLDRKFILWNHPRLALQKTIRRYRNAKLRPQAAPHIWKTTTKTSTAHSIRTKTNKLRSKIRHHYPWGPRKITRRIQQEVYTTSSGKFPILCASYRYDNFTRPQQHRNTARKNHKVNHERSSPITWLHGHAHQSHHKLPRIQHDTQYSLRHFILFSR